ncbi:hypothetical protein CI15_16575 [Paraburkholderia monticola]|uniref:Uncharacterized protein n=1 Tax=Paraburkholderia monticola TaxID=1399968 RepID=A0A149PPV8_9BURK|nr:hypothetical protein CI15_16575 [Paraburkholderia monticola]
MPLPPPSRPQSGEPSPPQPAGANTEAASSAAVGVPASTPVAAPSFCASSIGADSPDGARDVSASTIQLGITSVDAACATSPVSAATPARTAARPIIAQQY